MIISALLQYLTIPGIENCNSMVGIVSTYTSKDYLQGCHLLSAIKTVAISGELAGVGFAVFGVVRKPKN